jgi:hypothetical protein
MFVPLHVEGVIFCPATRTVPVPCPPNITQMALRIEPGESPGVQADLIPHDSLEGIPIRRIIRARARGIFESLGEVKRFNI